MEARRAEEGKRLATCYEFQLTDSMEQIPSWEANSRPASQEIRLLWYSKVHYRFHRRPPLSQMSPVHNVPTLFLQDSILMLSSPLRPDLPGGLSLSGFKTKTTGNFSLHHRVQTGTGAQTPASYPMGTRGSFPGAKAAEAWSWPLTSTTQYVYMAWCLVKRRDNFTHMYYMPRPSHPPWLDHPKNIWCNVQVMKLLVM
jgi:hypothetical protein